MQIYIRSEELLQSGWTEQWICDRFKDEFSNNNRDIVTNSFDKSNIVWLLAPWNAKDILQKIKYSDKIIITTVHHFVPQSKIHYELNEILKKTHILHVISNKTIDTLKQQFKEVPFHNKPTIYCPFWINENMFYDLDKSTMRTKYNIPINSLVIGSFQKDTEGNPWYTCNECTYSNWLYRKNEKKRCEKCKFALYPENIKYVVKNEKGADIFIDIINKYYANNPDLIVLLTGTRREYIMHELNKNNIKYLYYELIDTVSLNELYNCLDLYIVSSRIEGGPRAIFECGLTKTPIVSTDVGYATEILNPLCIFDMNDIDTFKNTQTDVEYVYNKCIQLTISKHMTLFVDNISKHVSSIIKNNTQNSIFKTNMIHRCTIYKSLHNLQYDYIKTLFKNIEISNSLKRHANSNTFKIMYLCNIKYFLFKMSRIRFHNIIALSNINDVELYFSGIGWHNYNNKLTVLDNIKKWNIDFNAVISYKPLEMLEYNQIPQYKCIRYNEMWDSVWTMREILDSGSNLVICHHKNDEESYHKKTVGIIPIGIKYIGHCSNNNIFKNYTKFEDKDIDVLMIGVISEKVYPIRHRLYKLLFGKSVPDKLSKYNLYHYKHVGYKIDTAYNDQQMIEFAKIISRSKICIACTSIYKYRLGKYVEIAMAGTAILGDLPYEDTYSFDKFIINIENDTDDNIVDTIDYYLTHTDELIEKINYGLLWSTYHETQIYANNLYYLLKHNSYMYNEKLKLINKYMSLDNFDLISTPLNYNLEYAITQTRSPNDIHKILKLSTHDNEAINKIKILRKNEFILTKCDRDKRLSEHLLYLIDNIPELFMQKPNNKYVVDLGPGQGETLEIARLLGYSVLGYDATISDCEMGDDYINYSNLMSKCQQLNIVYNGFENYKIELDDSSTWFVNSRGSIEQIFRDHLSGVPHKVHHKASKLAWIDNNDTYNAFMGFILECERVLCEYGILMIFGNGSSDPDNTYYNKMIIDIVNSVNNLEIIYTDYKTAHKIRKRTKKILLISESNNKTYMQDKLLFHEINISDYNKSIHNTSNYDNIYSTLSIKDSGLDVLDANNIYRDYYYPSTNLYNITVTRLNNIFREQYIVPNKKVLLICDIINWAWDYKAKSIQKYLTTYEIDIKYICNEPYYDYNVDNFDVYDIIFTFCWNMRLPPYINKMGCGVSSHNFEAKHYDIAIKTLPQFKAISCVSPIILNRLTKFNDNLFQGYNGVEERVFYPIRSCVNIDKLVIGWIGQNISKKANAKDAHGIQILNNIIKRFENNDNVIFKTMCKNSDSTDKIPYKDMLMEYYQHIDVMIHTGIMTGTPNPMFEAASSGKYLISTRIGCISELIHDGINGNIVDIFDHNYLGQLSDDDIDTIASLFEKHINNLLCNNTNEILENVSKYNRELILKKWTWNYRIGDWVSLFEFLYDH
jgi:glycosyltransferase involved in cell wall biosynthesis